MDCEATNSRGQMLFLSFISIYYNLQIHSFIILAPKLPLVHLNHSEFLAFHAAVRFLWPLETFHRPLASFLPVLLFRPLI
jgi:hypothetical protein